MQNIKNIIFDYGNVIFTIDFSITQKAFLDLGIKDVEKFYAHKNQHSIFNDFECGTISPAEFRAGFNAIAERNFTDTEIDTAWNSLLIGVPKGNHEALLATRNKYRTFLLSNNNTIHYQWIVDYLQREYGIADNESFFEKTYYSQNTGMRKPNPQIFQLLLDAHQLNPAETLFIDDSPQHIQGAQKVGLHTLLMDVPAHELPQFLKAKGIL